MSFHPEFILVFLSSQPLDNIIFYLSRWFCCARFSIDIPSSGAEWIRVFNWKPKHFGIQAEYFWKKPHFILTQLKSNERWSLTEKGKLCLARNRWDLIWTTCQHESLKPCPNVSKMRSPGWFAVMNEKTHKWGEWRLVILFILILSGIRSSSQM